METNRRGASVPGTEVAPSEHATDAPIAIADSRRLNMYSPIRRSPAVRLPRQLPELDAVRLIRVRAEPPLAIGFVVLVIALEPDDLAVALEREDVRGDAVEEPAVVADHDGAAGKRQQPLFERT